MNAAVNPICADRSPPRAPSWSFVSRCVAYWRTQSADKAPCPFCAAISDMVRSSSPLNDTTTLVLRNAKLASSRMHRIVGHERRENSTDCRYRAAAIRPVSISRVCSGPFATQLNGMSNPVSR